MQPTLVNFDCFYAVITISFYDCSNFDTNRPCALRHSHNSHRISSFGSCEGALQTVPHGLCTMVVFLLRFPLFFHGKENECVIKARFTPVHNLIHIGIIYRFDQFETAFLANRYSSLYFSSIKDFVGRSL